LLVDSGLAFVGIRIGRKRLERENWDSDPDFRNMFAANRSTGANEY
jgi:hypothetical protein